MQVYQSTKPWKTPIIILNIPEFLNLILEVVVTKYVDKSEDEAEEDVMENITRTY